MWLALSLAFSTLILIPLVAGNGPLERPGDAAALGFYLLLLHGLFFAPPIALAGLWLRLARPSPEQARRRLVGAALGALVLANGVLAWPVTYGPFSLRGDAFATPLGLWTLLLLLGAPPLGAALLADPRRWRRPFLLWGGALALTAFGHRVAERPSEVDFTFLDPPESADSVAGPGGSPGAATRHVTLLGFDGLSWNVLRPLLERGQLPTLEHWLRQGAYGHLATEVPTLSPAIWTSVATGRRPADHGIFAFSRFELPGVATSIGYGPSMSTPNWWLGANRLLILARRRGWVENRLLGGPDRRVPAIWDVADHHGLAAGMFGWLASRPVAIPRNGGFRAALPRWGSPSRFASPQGAAELDASSPVAHVMTPPDRKSAAVWQETHDAVSEAITLIRRIPTRLLTLYFRFPDPVQHRAWKNDRFLLGEGDPSFEQLPGPLVEAYRLFDHELGRLLAALPPRGTVLLVSDHGFRFDGRQHHHAPPGVIAAVGPGIRPGVIEGASIYDLFPTMANLLDIPIVEAAPGRVLSDLFVPGVLAPVRRVPSYDWYRPATGRLEDSSPAAQEELELERIRSLGYVN